MTKSYIQNENVIVEESDGEHLPLKWIVIVFTVDYFHIVRLHLGPFTFEKDIQLPKMSFLLLFGNNCSGVTFYGNKKLS